MSEFITPNELVARTLSLLSRAATAGVCKGRLRELIQHLECVVCDSTLDPAIRTTSEKLLNEWREIQTKEFGSESAKARKH